MKGASLPRAMRSLISELTKLPSIGEKSATRLAYHIVTNISGEGFRLAEAIGEVRDKVFLCENCFALAEGKLCEVCQDTNRDRSVICVVEKPIDVISIERSGGYRGLYHVLHGLWSPLRGVGLEQTRIPALIKRVQLSAQSQNGSKVEELIVATGTTVEGDATAHYIANSVRDLGLKVTRIAQGLPKGGELEFADEVTLSHAIIGRRSL